MGTKLSMGTCALLACIMFSCGDDDDAADRCGDADEVTCTCEDGDKGTAPCDADGGVGECTCTSDASSGGSGGSSASGSGGGNAGSSSGSGGSSASGSGGSAGSNDDGGTDPGPEPDSGTEPPPTMQPPAPMDGNQLASCDNDRDCNMNLGCYSPTRGGFCSRVCERDEDCASLMGAMYHCSQAGVCTVECANADDDASCPGGLQCLAIGGGGNQGGGDAFRCLYPPAMTDPEPMGTAFMECGGGGGGDGCMDGLNCVGDNGGNPGFCSHGCTPQDSDCSDVTAPSGTITASCVPQGPEQGVCALDCEAMPDGCPEGMECVEQGFYNLCRYMN